MSNGITVLICAYNGNHFLPTALKTVLAQTLVPDEILIVDDGSDSPVTFDNMEGVRIVRHKHNQGLAAARNTGIREARTSLIALLDADDGWESTKLAQQYKLMVDADRDVFGVFSAFRRTGRQLRAGIVRTPQVKDWHSFFSMGIRSGPGSTLMFRRDAALAVEPFDERMRRYEDWDWLLNVTHSGRFKFLSVDQPLANVLLSDRPSAAACAIALDLIEQKHLPNIGDAKKRRLFRAAINIERAAIARWEGRLGSALIHGLKAFTAPELIWRELKLTVNRA